MIKRSFTALVVLLCVSIITSCGGNTASPPTPLNIVFDSQSKPLLGGVRLAPAENNWDGYGEAVDVYGDVLVIGASDWNQLGPGSAYVYRLSKEGWQEETKLIAGDREVFIGQASQYGGQRFGSAVAVGDGIIAVGAPGSVNSGKAGYMGAVYVFAHERSGWIETARLVPGRLDPIEETRLEWLNQNRMKPRVFGSQVALSGDTLAVGGDADGTVYIYQRNGESWNEQSLVSIPTNPERDLYITSMSVFGETLSVGVLYLLTQPNPASFLTGSVAVYLFERDGTSWKEILRFLPDDGKIDYLFPRAIHLGASLALGGESGIAQLLAVGLPGWPDWSGDLDADQLGLSSEQISEFAEAGVYGRQSGTVYIFGRDDKGRWQQRTVLTPSGWDSPPGPGSFMSFFPSDLEQRSDAEKADFYATIAFPGHIYSAIPAITFFGATVDLDGSRLAVTSGFANSTYIFEQQDGTWVVSLRLQPKNVKLEFWEDDTQPIKISGHTLLLGTPSEFGNSAYVFNLCEPSMLDCK